MTGLFGRSRRRSPGAVELSRGCGELGLRASFVESRERNAERLHAGIDLAAMQRVAAEHEENQENDRRDAVQRCSGSPLNSREELADID